jgi:hypothetical protein
VFLFLSNNDGSLFLKLKAWDRYDQRSNGVKIFFDFGLGRFKLFPVYSDFIIHSNQYYLQRSSDFQRFGLRINGGSWYY